MVGELVNVLDRPVAIEGGCFDLPGKRDWAKREAYTNVGGYSLELSVYQSGMGRVELRENGPGSATHMHYFATAADARAEHARLEALLFARSWVGWVTNTLTAVGIVPAEFLPALRAGELEALLVAADWQDERGAANAAILLRAAYYRIRGAANVAVRAGKGVVIVLNPVHVTPRNPAKPGIGDCRAAVIEEGRSVRIVKAETSDKCVLVEGRWRFVPRAEVEERTFAVGSVAEYDSFNLVYYAAVESVTARSVVIAAGRRGKKTRLTIGAFVEKNHDFDLERARRRNDEWTD